MFKTNFYYTNDVLEIIKTLHKLIEQLGGSAMEQYMHLMNLLKEIYQVVESKHKEIQLLLRTTDNNLNEEIISKVDWIKVICQQINDVIKEMGVSWEKVSESTTEIVERFKNIIRDLEAGDRPGVKNVADVIENTLKDCVKDIKEVYLIDRWNGKRKKIGDHFEKLKKKSDDDTKTVVDKLKKPKEKILTVEVVTVGEKLCDHKEIYNDP